MDQDIMLNALNAPDIKAAYESNADTNAFTDAEQTRLSGLELGVTVQPYDVNTVVDANYETFDSSGNYVNLRAQATTAEDVGLGNVDNVKQAIVETYVLQISTEDWTGTEPAIAVKSVNGILSTDQPIVDINLKNIPFNEVAETEIAYGLIYLIETTNNNEITFSALEPLNKTITVNIQVVR
jgi:hypothetical protein